MRFGISNMAFLLLSILSITPVSKRDSQYAPQPYPAVNPDVLDSQLPLVLVALDLLANTSTLDAQTKLDPLA
jgi:hypothetical protein